MKRSFRPTECDAPDDFTLRLRLRGERLRRRFATLAAGAVFALSLLSGLPGGVAAMGFSPGGSPPPWDPPDGLLPPDLPAAGRAAMCRLRDEGLGNAHWLFQRLGLGELFKNYYCDGGCFMCCNIGGNAGCHSSFDYSDEGAPPINCNSAVYGPGTTIVGEALIIGDPLGTGICIGGVQQLCNHLPVCSGGGGPGAPAASAATALPAPSGRSLEPTDSVQASESAEASPFATASAADSPPAHPDMSLPGAIGSRAKAFTKAILHNFTQDTNNRAAGLRFRDYVDFATARGARYWRLAMTDIEPFSESYDVFREQDEVGVLLPHESYQLGILYHANLALLGGVPNLLDRLAYVESRYWSEQEKDDYLAGVDPELELRQTMGPIGLAALKQVPIQDWRLLAVPSPSEPVLSGRTFEGFELGVAPSVNVAIDCAAPGETSLAISLDDPEAGVSPGFIHPVIVNWGDGSFSRHEYDSALASLVAGHRYAEPGTYQAYVTASNVTGLSGVAGIVVENTAAAALGDPVSITRLELDDVNAYGPALITAGDLAFDIQVRRPDGTEIVAGWTEQVRLAFAGATPIGGMIAHNDSKASIDAVVFRPEIVGQYFYDSSYLQTDSITLGFYDPQLGEETTRTLPLTADMLGVYYEGAIDPVPPELLERDINGDLIIPLERQNEALPANFCGGATCALVDRIEIALTPELLAQRPMSPPSAPLGSTIGSVARWLEDVPGLFVPDLDLSSASVESGCGGTLSVDLVAAEEPTPSFVAGLSLVGASPSVSEGEIDALQAMATLIDGSLVDVTERVTWTSSDPTVLTISNGQQKGQLETGILPGTAMLSATLGELEVSTVGTNARAERGYAHYRFLVTEIHGAVQRAGVNAVELIVEGTVLENRMESDTDGSIGPFPADVSTSPGTGAVYAFDPSFGSGWTSPTGSFESVAPFVVGPDPVFLQVSFEQPTPVEGIRLHRQSGIHSASFQPQFPKEVVIEASNDGINFDVLTTHRVENWDYLPVEIAIPVPELGFVMQLLAGGLWIVGIRAKRRPTR